MQFHDTFLPDGRLSIRKVHIAVCLGLVCFVTWGLLTSDPLAITKDTSLQIVRAINDAIMHCGVYLVFSTACFSLLRRRTDRRPWNIMCALLITHAIVTEVLQRYVPCRVPDPIDAFANIVGIFGGAVVAARIWKPRAQRAIVDTRRW